MKLSKTVIIFFLLFAWSETALAKNIVELYLSIELNNNLNKAAQVQSISQSDVVSEARAALLPHIGAEAKYGYSDSNLTLKDNFAYINQFPSNFKSSDRGYIYLVGIKQDLMNLKSWRDLSASKYLAAAKALDSPIVLQQQTFAMLESYFKALQVKNHLQLLIFEHNELQQLRKRYIYEYSHGSNTKLAIYEVNLKLQGVAIEKLNLQSELEHHLSTVSDITGEDVTALQEVLPRNVLTLLPPKNESYWLKNVVVNNLELRKAQLELRALREEIYAQKAEAYPVITAEADYSKGQANLPIFNTATDEDKSVSVGIKIPIFTGGYITAKTSAERHKYMSDKFKYDDAESMLQNSVKEIYDDILTLHEKLLLDQKVIIVVKRAVKSVKNAHAAGFKDVNEILVIEKQYLNAQLNYKKDAYDVLLLRAKLYQLNGELNRDEIQRLNAIFS